MADFNPIRDAVTEYVRDYIDAKKRRGLSYKKIAKDLECTHPWVIDLHQRETRGFKNVGPELEQRVADLLHGGSVDALRRAALHVAGGGKVVAEGPDGEKVEITSKSKPTSSSAPPKPRPDATGGRPRNGR